MNSERKDKINEENLVSADGSLKLLWRETEDGDYRYLEDDELAETVQTFFKL